MKKLLILIFCLPLLVCCDPFSLDLPESSEKELKDNYDKRHKEIAQLKTYFNSITPKDLEVYIEFSSEESVDIRVYYITTTEYPRKVLFEQWDINPYNFKPAASPNDNTEFAAETNSLEAVKRRLGWTDNTFKTIKKFLDNANCISVTNGNPANIGFRRSGMGMYFYNLFENPLSDSLKKVYNDSCTFRLYYDTLALEYGGGAVGPQCFPDK